MKKHPSGLKSQAGYISEVCIKDLPDNIRTNILLFADDNKIFRKIQYQEDRTELQEDIDQLQKWSEDWVMNFHPDKSKALIINKKLPEKPKYNITINSEIHTITNVESEKDLGVIFNANLSFQQHINEKIAKANKMAGLIRRSLKHLNAEMFVPIYKTLVRIHFDYTTPIWYTKSEKLKDKIESVQRRSTKYIYEALRRWSMQRDYKN